MATGSSSNNYVARYPDQAYGFPALATDGHEIKSAKTLQYNCIAWAIGTTKHWYWPGGVGTQYWPRQLGGKDPRVEPTLENFKRLFNHHGYCDCDNGEFDPEVIKVAIYGRDGHVTHAARQTTDGKWTSKMGSNEDIEHPTVASVEGRAYGEVLCYMARRRKKKRPRIKLHF